MKRRLVAGLIGCGIGYAIATYGRLLAEARVKILPRLADVDWWEAMLTGHLGDWLFYHYPEAVTVVLCVVWVGICLMLDLISR